MASQGHRMGGEGLSTVVRCNTTYKCDLTLRYHCTTASCSKLNLATSGIAMFLAMFLLGHKVYVDAVGAWPPCGWLTLMPACSTVLRSFGRAWSHWWESCRKWKTQCLVITSVKQTVARFNPSEKYDFVSWDDCSQSMEIDKIPWFQSPPTIGCTASHLPMFLDSPQALRLVMICQVIASAVQLVPGILTPWRGGVALSTSRCRNEALGVPMLDGSSKKWLTK